MGTLLWSTPEGVNIVADPLTKVLSKGELPGALVKLQIGPKGMSGELAHGVFVDPAAAPDAS